MRRVSMALIACGALLASREANAQQRCGSAAQVESLEAEGLRLNRAGNYGAASARFEQSYALCHGASAQARLAITLLAMGRWGEADTWMRRALSTSTDPWIVQNRAQLARQASVIARHVGTLLVSGDGGAGEVLVDGRHVADFPMVEPVSVTAGSIVMTVRATGYVQVTRALQVSARSAAREHVTLQREPPPEAPVATVSAPVTPALTRIAAVPVVARTAANPTVVIVRDGATPEAPRRDDGYRNASNTYRVLGGASAGVSLAVLTATIITHVIREDRINGANDEYAGDPACNANPERLETNPEHCAPIHQRAVDADESLTPWVIAGYATAGAFAVTSAVLFAIAPSRTRPQHASGWQCGSGPGTFGVSCGATF